MLHRNYPPTSKLLLDGVTFGEFQNTLHMKEFNPLKYSVHYLSQIIPWDSPSSAFLVEAEGSFFISTVRYDTFLGF